jgi:hypothetical protein
MDTHLVGSGARAGQAEGALVAVGVYQLLAPLVSGRSVVEIGGPLLPDAQTRLERAGASQVVTLAADSPSLPLADGAADLVLCLDGPPGPRRGGDPDRPDPWIAELRRILKPDGTLVMRVQRAAEDAADGPRALQAALGAAFARIDLATENGFVGVSFFVSGTEDIAIGGDLARLAARPTHDLLICSGAAAAPLTESLLIPLEGLQAELARRATWQKAVDADRDELREQLMALQERFDRTDAALAELRRRAARQLERTSDNQDAIEALTLERDQAVARAQRAEKAVTDLEAAARRRDVEISASKSEIARLRARLTGAVAPGPARASEIPPAPTRNDKRSA